MRELQVYLEIMGSMVYIGKICGNDPEDSYFSYDGAYLSSADARPISISLPLTSSPFSPSQTKTFFEGLLPEGFTRRTVAQWMHADENDYLTILSTLGNECLGAIRIAENDMTKASPSYELLDLDRIKALAGEGATESAQMVTEAHLSLTGASGKVGLYYDKEGGNWYLPAGDAPSNYIVKQSHIRYDGIVTNEKLCLLTASKLGIDVPYSFIINTGTASESEVLFATERYDRKKYSGELISGLRKPLRLHQEDFAQALGIPSASKYEKSGDNYLSLMADLLRRHSSNPIEDITKLWDIVVFNWLIGNTDSHIKNFSLLYDDLQSVRLAPAYDMISTVIYSGTARSMSFNIGGEYIADRITTDSWKRAASQAGIGRGLALDRLDSLSEALKPALIESAEELYASGFHKAKQISEAILSKGGISRIV